MSLSIFTIRSLVEALICPRLRNCASFSMAATTCATTLCRMAIRRRFGIASTKTRCCKRPFQDLTRTEPTVGGALILISAFMANSLRLPMSWRLPSYNRFRTALQARGVTARWQVLVSTLPPIPPCTHWRSAPPTTVKSHHCPAPPPWHAKER